MLTAKAAIQLIRDQVRRVRQQGGSLIPAESLEQFLNLLDSGQVDRDLGLIIAANREAATAKYRARVESGLELFKSVIQSGHAALKSLFLLNGGAAVAVLALVGHLSTSPIAAGQVNKFACPLLWFAVGLTFAAIASGLTYLVQRAYAGRNRRRGGQLNALTVLLSICSIVAFVVGSGVAYFAIQAIAAIQSSK
jgi:hypothetical protein